MPALSKTLIILCAALTLIPAVTSPMALTAGILIALTLRNPWAAETKKISPKLLTYSVVALGAGMNLNEVARAGIQGFSYTLISISLTLCLGLFIMRLLKSDYESSLLITVGTAICGGSAIAAVAPTINAKSSTISVALAVVFLLNSVALLCFPAIGHSLGFSQEQFGIWAALAIHDTSSVVGSTMQYGAEALRIGTTTKLTRALWIVPIALCIGYLHSRYSAEGAGKKNAAKFPWFILGFLLMAGFFSYAAGLHPWIDSARTLIEFAGRRGMVLTLLLIGLNLNPQSFRDIGFKPVGLGIILWFIISTVSAFGILRGVGV